MLHRLLPELRRHGFRGLLTWYHSSTRTERIRMFTSLLRIVFEIALFVAWPVLLFTWSLEMWGSEGLASEAGFFWFLLLWWPVLSIVRIVITHPPLLRAISIALRAVGRFLLRLLKKALRLLGRLLSWVIGLRFGPPIHWQAWRPFWFATLGGLLYLTIRFRPWGLFPALFLAGCSVMVYLLLHVGGNFGTGIPMRNIAVSQKHHPIGFFVFGFGALPWYLSFVPFAPIAWVLTTPLLWYFKSWTWMRILSSGAYWLVGLGTLIYWILWAAIKWRKYGNLITTNGDVIAVTPKLGLRPGVRIATASISKIATVAGEALLGAYPVYDPGFQFQGGDRYSARWVRKEFVEEVDRRRTR